MNDKAAMENPNAAFIPSRKQVLIHVAVWLAYMGYEQLSAYIISGRLSGIPEFLYFYGCNITLFYTHVALLRRYLSDEGRQYLTTLTFMLSEMALFLTLKGIWEYYCTMPPVLHASEPALFRKVLLLDLVRNLYYAGFATLYWAVDDNIRSRKVAAIAHIEKLELAQSHAELETVYANTRNAYLQQQLNPHLLSNTLSFIYNSVRRSSEPAGQAVLLLSDIMHFSYSPLAQDGRIRLSDEIEQIQNLVQINRYRFNYPVLLDFTVEGDPGELRIIPLILLTLTENMIKHGVFEQIPGKIAIDISGTRLRFSTVNSKRQNGKAGNGIGLHNIRLRLDHAYRDRYQIEVMDTEHSYQLNLTMEL